MKWNEENTKKLKDLCMAGVSNADMAKQFNCPVVEIHALRSKLGLTIPKVKAMKEIVGNSERAAVEIRGEIKLVLQAQKNAQHKLQRCSNRLEELVKELEVVR